MTGNAVETTRLSRDAMNRASPVMTTAHTARDLARASGDGWAAPGRAGAPAAGAPRGGVPAEARPDGVALSVERVERWTVGNQRRRPDFTVDHSVSCEWSLTCWLKKRGAAGWFMRIPP
jgi:hypothetical protein